MAESDILNYVRILGRWRRFILGLVALAAVGSLAASYLLPKWYRARSTLIPPRSDSELGSSLSSLMSGLTLPGIGNVLPGSAEIELFLAILDSRTLRERLVRDFDLQKIYKVRTMDDAVRAQRALATVALTDQGVVQVEVEDRDPQRAANIANAWVSYLDEFNRSARMTSGKRTRLFVENRLAETRVALRAAEDTVSRYQMMHKAAPLGSDISAAIESSAQILARRMALQVQSSILADLYREGAPQLMQNRGELAALDRQIETIPPLAMDYARLVRDLKVQEQVYALLVAQYEEARIRENKDMPTVEVLDPAVPPQRRSRPIRWLFCASITFASIVIGVGTAFGVEFYASLRRRLAS